MGGWPAIVNPLAPTWPDSVQASQGSPSHGLVSQSARHWLPRPPLKFAQVVPGGHETVEQSKPQSPRTPRSRQRPLAHRELSGLPSAKTQLAPIGATRPGTKQAWVHSPLMLSKDAQVSAPGHPSAQLGRHTERCQSCPFIDMALLRLTHTPCSHGDSESHSALQMPRPVSAGGHGPSLGSQMQRPLRQSASAPHGLPNAATSISTNAGLLTPKPPPGPSTSRLMP